MSNVKRRLRRFAVIAALAAALSGCAMSDDSMARFVVAPDKYLLYNCEEIAREAKTAAAREQELHRLMVRASADPAGRLVSGIAYDSDYLTVRGELNELRAAAVSKHCEPVPDVAAPANAGAVR